MLSDIGGFYSAKNLESFTEKKQHLTEKCERLESDLGEGPYFSGSDFSLVDAVFGPVFRYFDVFDNIDDFGIMSKTPKVNAWRHHLATRPSVIGAVSADYNELLHDFLLARQSYLTRVMSRA